MLGNIIVAKAQEGFDAGQQVELSVPDCTLTRISEISHVGQDLLHFRYPGMDVDHYVIAAQVGMLRIRPLDD
jgi:hypothetical protein